MEYGKVVGTQPTKGLPILHQEELICDDFGMNSFIKEFISFLFLLLKKKQPTEPRGSTEHALVKQLECI